MCLIHISHHRILKKGKKTLKKRKRRKLPVAMLEWKRKAKKTVNGVMMNSNASADCSWNSLLKNNSKGADFPFYDFNYHYYEIQF